MEVPLQVTRKVCDLPYLVLGQNSDAVITDLLQGVSMTTVLFLSASITPDQ